MYHEGVMDLPFSFILARRAIARSWSTQVSCRTNTARGSPAISGSRHGSRPFACLPKWTSRAEAITDIFMTHAHFDHMGSIAEFPNAHIHIQKSELLSWYEMIALPKRFGYLTAIIDPDNLRAALDASIEHRVTLIDGDKDNVLPGIHVRLGSGHTIGQQFVVIDTAAGRRLISGDCVYSRRQFTGQANDGVYVPLNNAVGSVWEQLKTDRQDE